ncbi:DUF3095 domain-containing protein [Chachezhania antarctica]|uniref:DUF3095 domain-containing protein n=1 Tax=Chachezhania antarctica TaxID=2340860 RepID=UPI000EB4D247|nr:DUF3095 domain-containing protein [Chachezhania antarctica]
MAETDEETGFYDRVPKVSDFDSLADPAAYVALPDDWVLGLADIENSTAAIEAGRYKTVNMVGAAVISAQVNAHGSLAFPFVFGGDGAGFAVPPDRRAAAEAALVAVQAWALEEFDLTLRVALVSVAEIRAAGHSLQVARYAVASGVDYAMFSGGGMAWAEEQMKTGAFALDAPATSEPPDLTGLSCRWSHIRAQNGTIVSLVVLPAGGGAGFSDLVRDLVGLTRDVARGGHPVPVDGPGTSWPPPGARLEAHATRGTGGFGAAFRKVLAETLFSFALFRTKLKLGSFDPTHYARTVSANADFRKFDDGLKMTLDLDAATLAALRSRLELAARAGVARYGIHEQAEAMMTCIVPAVMRDDHVHFVDGASGGYTRAAAVLRG